MIAGQRPIVAIDGELTPLTKGVGGAGALHLPLRYAAAVERAGGLPLVLPALASPSFVDEIVGRVDALVFSGGDDFDTEALGLGPTHPRARPVPREKQAFDLALARAALGSGLPVLGICYGMQLVALAEGARLHQHLPDDRPGIRQHAGGVVHEVLVGRGTKLRELLGVASVDVVSRHHQALASTGPLWRVSGRDDQGTIEAIERTGHPLALGVQWHPELAPDEAASALQGRLFAGLVRAAGARRAAREQRGLAEVGP